MYENTKAAFLRRGVSRSYHNVFKGNGLHISPGNDPLKKIHYPMCSNIETVDISEARIGGDKLTENLKEKTFDFVYATNITVYEEDPVDVINHWLKFVKSKGHLIITAPDEDLYEQGNFPSVFNNTHKKTFSIYKESSWSGKHYNFLDIIQKINTACCRKIELIDSNYDYSLIGKGVDQTINFQDGVEACIEVILKKY
jgi:SAM-dependent methyltransferase